MRSPLGSWSCPYLAWAAAFVFVAGAVFSAPALAESGTRKVKGRMQARPGGPVEEVEVAVHEVPVDLPSVPADRAPLKDDDLVLGVLVDGQAMAYPIRYLAMYEVVDGRVGRTPVAPTW